MKRGSRSFVRITATPPVMTRSWNVHRDCALKRAASALEERLFGRIGRQRQCRLVLGLSFGGTFEAAEKVSPDGVEEVVIAEVQRVDLLESR